MGEAPHAVPGARAKCRNCGKTIILEGRPSWYWFHPEGQTVWCIRNDGERSRAEPA